LVTSSRSLSAADAAFLFLERKEIPLAIACITIFDGPIPFEKFAAGIASKLRQVPRYKQVVADPPLNLDMPTWVDDPHFDIRNHVFQLTLKPPGGEPELEALAGRIFSQLLDRNKPLWEVYVIDGLKGGRNAVIWRLHHALADGVSANRLLELFLDTTPEGSPVLRGLRRRQTSNPTPAGGISGVVQSTLDGLIAAERGLLGFARSLLGDPTREGSKSLLDLLPELLASVERLPFNKPCGKGRKFCWAEFEMAEVKAIREAGGGRVNDVVLTVLTRALARYVKLHGQSVVNRLVRIVCPVNLRKPGQEERLGNQISFIPVALPMDVRDPVEMLRAVAARTEVMKGSGAAALVGLLAAGIAKAPPPLQALFWWGLPELIFPVPILNMICTNVPGPAIPLYAAGRRMIATYPQVPTGYELGINCAVASYDGKLFFGLIADAQVAPDVKRLRDFLYVAFEELLRAAQKKAGVEARTNRRPGRDVRARRGVARRRTSKAAESLPHAPEVPSAPARIPATPTAATSTPATPAAPARQADEGTSAA
jgi:diacylglycerol O-acyltransferase